MRKLRAWAVRMAGVFGNLFGRTRLDRELSAELESHLQLHIDDNIRAGMSPQEARRRAVIKLGGIESTKESYRDRRSIPVIETLLQDVRFGLRILRKNPGFTAVAVLTLALGIGANSAIFSLIDTLLLRPLPVPNPSQLVYLKWASQQPARWKSFYAVGVCEQDVDETRTNGCGFSFAAFDQIRAHATSVAGVAAISTTARLHISLGSGTEHTLVTARCTSGNFFAVLEVPAFLGRAFLLEDDRIGANPVAVISYNLWRDRFGSDASAIGRAIFVEDVPFTVVGVAPQGFPGVNQFEPNDIWIPAHAITQFKWHSIWTTPDAPTPSFGVIARMKPEISWQRAQAELTSLYRAAMKNDPHQRFADDAPPEIVLHDFSHGTYSYLRKQFTQPLAILMVIVSCVLLIACANIASLNLARASARRAEIAVRFALGAGRGRLLRQLFTESLLLAVMGAAAGLLLSIWLTRFLAAFVGHGLSVQPLLDVRPSALILAYTVGVATFSAVFFGLVPAITSSRVNPAAVMKSGGGANGNSTANSIGERGTRRPLARILVVAQITIALMLLVGAGLFLRTLRNLELVNTGFDKEHLLVVTSSLASDPDAQGPRISALNNELRERISALPGVLSVSWGTVLLGDGIFTNTFTVERNGPAQERGSDLQFVGPDIFKTMGIPVLAGRDVEPHDLREKSGVAWINHAFAQKFFPSENPIGKRLHPHMQDWLAIVGVVGDTKYEGVREEMPPTVFESLSNDWPAHNIMIRSAGDPAALANVVRQVVHQQAPEATIVSVETESQKFDRHLFYERLMARLSLIFGLLAMLLTCVGVYGVLAYATAQRTGEIAIRISLGAMPSDILRLIISDGLRPAIAGTILGLLGSFALTTLLAKFLYGIKPFDPATFCVATALLLCVAAFACYIPARRATRVNPMVALRND
jgi:predicted permease